MNEQAKRIRNSKIKLGINIFVASIMASVCIAAAVISITISLNGFNYDILKDAGILFLFIISVCIVSGTLMFLLNFIKEMIAAISLYRFYKKLLGQGSLSLFAETYQSVSDTVNVPLNVKHINGNKETVFGTWIGVGKWKVNNKHTTRGYKKYEEN